MFGRIEKRLVPNLLVTEFLSLFSLKLMMKMALNIVQWSGNVKCHSKCFYWYIKYQIYNLSLNPNV